MHFEFSLEIFYYNIVRSSVIILVSRAPTMEREAVAPGVQMPSI